MSNIWGYWRKRVQWLLIVWVLCCMAPVGPMRSDKVRKVVIDAGHGGKDPGAKGKKGSIEKDIALDIALETGRLIRLRHPDVQIIYTRHTNVFVGLKERSQLANKEKADLFISIHCNAHPSAGFHGTETYIMGLDSSDENLAVARRENASILQEADHQRQYGNIDPNSPASWILFSNYQQLYQARSLSLATKIEQQFSQKLKRHSRGVKQAGFWVLAYTAMPSVLVEVGFLTHAEEEQFVRSDAGKTLLATSIYRAFRDYKEEIETTHK